MALVDVNPDFWRSRRVLVTGHTGFKGSWLSLWLSAMKARVSGFALDPPTSPSLFVRAQVADVVDDARGDIRDIEAFSHALAKSKPDVVFHLAAQSVLRESYVDPIGTVSTNVMGTLNVLEAVRQFNLKAKAERSGDGVRSLITRTADGKAKSQKLSDSLLARPEKLMVTAYWLIVEVASMLSSGSN